jgi:hypothetical protein
MQHGVGDPEPDADRQERQVDQRHDFNLWVRRPAWRSIVGFMAFRATQIRVNTS